MDKSFKGVSKSFTKSVKSLSNMDGMNVVLFVAVIAMIDVVAMNIEYASKCRYLCYCERPRQVTAAIQLKPGLYISGEL